MSTTTSNGDSWREHFSVNAADLLAVQAWVLGRDWLQNAILRCMKRSRSGKINERTVLAVLDELGREAKNYEA